MSQSSNIILGNAATLGQTDSIVIGTSQTTTQIAGIYNKSVNTAPQQLIVDATGKLGTTTLFNAGQDSFLYYLPAENTNVTGDGTNFYLGCQNALIAQYDNTGGAFYGGAAGLNSKANAACFTAPANGYYFFSLSIFFSVPSAPSGEEYTYNYLILEIDGTWAATYANVMQDDPTGFIDYYLFPQSFVNSVVVQMAAGDKAYFTFQANSVAGTKTGNNILTAGGALGGAYVTYVCGFRIL